MCQGTHQIIPLNIFCPLTIGKGSIEIYLYATLNDPEGGWGLPISHKRD